MLSARADDNYLLVDTPSPARRVRVATGSQAEVAFPLDNGRQRWQAAVPPRSGNLSIVVFYADGGDESILVRVRTP